jgi:hypothetical protein
MVTITPVQQQLPTGEVITGYRIDGAAPLFEDGTIIPEGYDPDEDASLTPQQKLALNNILDSIDSGGVPGAASQQMPQIPQYSQQPQVSAPQIPYPQGLPFPSGPTGAFPAGGYTQPGNVGAVTGGDTAGYINQKARSFMDKKWSWLDRSQEIMSTPEKAFSIYMRKQRYNAAKIGAGKSRRSKRKKTGTKIPSMFRF